MLRKDISPRLTCKLIVGLSGLAALTSIYAAPDDAAQDAAAYLEFESKADGRCQTLSEGGMLRVMRNTHREYAIRYRLTRIFVDVPQGLLVGVAPPGGEEVALGCSKVDGRDQHWTVERASFTE